jgi:hypothetical protein
VSILGLAVKAQKKIDYRRQQLVFMTIELIIGVAIGYIPCEPPHPQSLSPVLTKSNIVIDNFGEYFRQHDLFQISSAFQPILVVS